MALEVNVSAFGQDGAAWDSVHPAEGWVGSANVDEGMGQFY